jgi:hypothetical protein
MQKREERLISVSVLGNQEFISKLELSWLLLANGKFTTKKSAGCFPHAMSTKLDKA